MITKNDTVFQYYKPKQHIDGNSFAVIGDNTKEAYKTSSYYAFAFDTYALGYKNGAEAIYEKFCNSKGNYAMMDTIVYPMVFCYRHMTELLIKYLYREHSKCTKQEFSDFLCNTSHNLKKAWKHARPCLEELRNRVKTTVDVDAIIHYIDEISKFDSGSFRMRYPVSKNLDNMNPNLSMLDIHKLHDRMTDFYDSVMEFSDEISNQVLFEIPQKEIERFVTEFENVRNVIPQILALREAYNNYRDAALQDVNGLRKQVIREIELRREAVLSDINNPIKKYNEYVGNLTDNQLITLQAIYYCFQNHFNYPNDVQQRKIDYAKACVAKMKYLRTIYDEEIDRNDCSNFL